jgi:hypothetical protein
MLAGALRYASLGLMAAGGAALFAKRQRLVRNGRCINTGICVGCKILQDCSLPRAVTARKTLSGINNDSK